MTAIYAAFSITERRAFVGADDLEGTEGRRENKLRFLLDRFVVGVMGSDNPIHAIDRIFEKNSQKDLKECLVNAEVLAQEIGDWTKGYTSRQIEQHKDNQDAQEKIEYVKDMGASIVIFDLVEFQLYECDFGKIFPPDSFDPTKRTLRKLEENKLHLFALAETVRQKKNMPLGKDAFSKPMDYMKGQIRFDQSQRIAMNRQLASQGQPLIPEIGNLGAYFIYDEFGHRFEKI